jgi:class 3 adenylate cyclase/energy-coupling factor transporter ATP-binding protein EcfA2
MRFCGNCGARLAGDIREKPIPPPTIQGLTTDELGIMMGKGLVKRLRSAGLEARGQRRNVTVLFANLAGITPLSEDVDEEDMYESVSQFVRMLSDNVYKYEGIIDKFTGNGLMALFGAPISHENIAERAVRAALDMQSDMVRLNDKLSKSYKMKANARIGIHSGSVVVGGVGTNMMMDYTAIGDTVNLAQRIEEAADPGTILLSESTFRQVRAFFDCDQVSKHSPNGAANKITAYQVAGIKEQPQSLRGIEGLHAPMIGRDQELVRLKQVANRLIETRQGQFVLVTGEAGLGKSRLTAELEATIDTREIRTLHGRSLAYRRTVPYWIIRDVIYSYLNVSPSDPDSQIGHHLSRLVKLVLKEQAERVLPFLENLLSLPYSDPIGADLINHLDPRQLHQLTFLAVHDLLMAEAAERPILIVLDDLHWADEASLDMIAFLLRSLPETPVFLLAISRTSDLELLKKATQFADEHLGQNFERITLKSLSTNQSDRLLSLLLSIPDLPEKFREQILSPSSSKKYCAC